VIAHDPMSHPSSTSVEATMPAGPWLLVVGMHRSGTSAVTGALGYLGFAVPVAQDRWAPSPDNPDHWESRALGNHDDAVLEQIGGTWDRPPDPELDWESDPCLGLDEVGDPVEAAGKAFPNPGPIVWKDPRTCLLMPYWLARIPKPVAAVFIWRSPLSVARSLQARDGMHLADGVALWERYNRSALTGLVGVDTFVLRYESIIEDPVGELGELIGWLEDLPQFAAHAPLWNVRGATAGISPELLRQHPSDESEILLGEQSRLVEHLNSLVGPHRPLASPSQDAESPWTTAVLGDRHQLAVLSLQRDMLRKKVRDQSARAIEASGEMMEVSGELAVARSEIESLRAELEGLQQAYEQLLGSTSWQVTRPLRQVAGLRGRKGTSLAD
jgi:hypothetical protein